MKNLILNWLFPAKKTCKHHTTYRIKNSDGPTCILANYKSNFEMSIPRTTTRLIATQNVDYNLNLFNPTLKVNEKSKFIEGWFIERPIGDYDERMYYGVFTSKKKTLKHIEKLKSELFEMKTGYYSMSPVFLPYIEFENNIVPLCAQNYCELINED